MRKQQYDDTLTELQREVQEALRDLPGIDAAVENAAAEAEDTEF